MTTLSALAQITANLRAHHDSLTNLECLGPNHCPLAKAIADLGEVMDGIAKEMGGNSDAKRLDWWQLAILSEQCDPEQQFIKINEGPMIGEMTLVIYDGRQCTNYRAATIREVLDLAMCAKDHLEAPAAPQHAPEEASTVRSPAGEPAEATDKYILNDQGEPVPEPDTLKWGSWLQWKQEMRKVIKEKFGESEVSTVFLGLDHAYGTEVGPILWETMVFGGPLEGEQDRCGGNRSDALAMHARMVARVTAPATGKDHA